MRLAHLHLPNITPFSRVANIQQTLTSRLLSHKKHLTPNPPDPTIITFSPNPVYTTGRRDLPPSNTLNNANANTLSLPPSLEPIRQILTSPQPNTAYDPTSGVAEYHPTLRGGQTTYHGPGQLVAYTILDLRRLGLTPRCHIRLLENSVIDVLREYGVRGMVTEDPGVWVHGRKQHGGSEGGKGELPKKITAVGVHLRRHISSYGIGLNVTEEPMWWFRQIVACGLEGRETTSLQGLGVEGVTVEEVAGRFVGKFVGRVNGDFACGEGATGEGIDEVYRVSEDDLLKEELE
ncbi:lipoyltransferase [Aspergillus costaricaensis CBS 115574]|uniref:Lipoyltransferase n=1 Tax=Aspergillus costaricaensis CBS 115574 TaxID=1448317 RepID=A0ACD1IQJ2_9EURO|nr:lipoyltransferase [Aspergillus costaricaensis CBS 115574]RAK92593.1 lipoyltransferase [Aspergillus costaricaensis CBS 115574]